MLNLVARQRVSRSSADVTTRRRVKSFAKSANSEGLVASWCQSCDESYTNQVKYYHQFANERTNAALYRTRFRYALSSRLARPGRLNSNHTISLCSSNRECFLSVVCMQYWELSTVLWIDSDRSMPSTFYNDRHRRRIVLRSSFLFTRFQHDVRVFVYTELRQLVK